MSTTVMTAHKLCKGCGANLKIGINWQGYNADNYIYLCNVCSGERSLARSTAWARANPVKRLRTYTNYRRELKRRAYELVSGSTVARCSKCGCDDSRVLEINHKNGGGRKEGLHGMRFYAEIIKGRRTTEDLEIVCRPDNALHYVELKYPDLKGKFAIAWGRN